MAVTEGQANNLPGYLKAVQPTQFTSPLSTGPHAPSAGRTPHCDGEHTYYMASEIEVPERGKLILVGFCTHCANPMQLEFDILRK